MSIIPIASIVKIKPCTNERDKVSRRSEIIMLGVRVLEISNLTVVDLPINDVDRTIVSKAAIYRLPKIEEGVIIDDYKLTILSVIKDVGYKVSDYAGNLFIASEKELIKHEELTNAKIVTVNGNKKVIKPIKGKFIEESVTIPKIVLDTGSKITIITGHKPIIKFICQSVVVLDCGDFDIAIDIINKSSIKCKAMLINRRHMLINLYSGIIGETTEENGNSKIIAISNVLIGDNNGFRQINNWQLIQLISSTNLLYGLVSL